MCEVPAESSQFVDGCAFFFAQPFREENAGIGTAYSTAVYCIYVLCEPPRRVFFLLVMTTADQASATFAIVV